MRILIDTPWYFLLLCLLCGVVYSVALYFWDKRSLRIADTFPKNTTWLLAALRFLAVSLVALLLLSPMVKRTVSTKEKPIVLVVQDNSSSLNGSPDSAYYRDRYASEMRKMTEELERDYEVHRLVYGSQVRLLSDPDYSDHTTDIAEAIGEMAQRYANRNVGAMVLTGDGIYNQGANPVTSAEGLLFPIYTVAMGDTSVRKDAAIVSVRNNSVAYLGNQFSLEISVSAKRLAGRESRLTVTHEGRCIYAKNLRYSDDHHFEVESVLVDADKAGLQSYTISIAPVADEVTLRNNTRVVSVDVIDGRQKILILAAAPHPDVSALRQSIESNQNYEVTASIAKDFQGDVSQYDLAVLHQLPMKGESSAAVAQVVKAHLPTIYVLGGLSDLARFNSLHSGVEIFAKIDRQNESAPLYNSKFSSFSFDESLWRKIEQFPPLSSPFGDYKMSETAQSLFTAKVGNVSSGLPLILFAQQQDIRSAVVAGEGLWRWRLADYQNNGTHEAFDHLVGKMVNYTSLRISKERFHVTAEKVYRENSQVQLEAELYNDNYEPVNTPEVTLKLTPERGKSASYNFNRSGSGYQLSLGELGAGVYRYEASTHFNGKDYSQSGTFLVEQLDLESLRLEADHSLMLTLAQNSGGEMLMPSDVATIPQLLRQRDDIKNVLYSHTKYSELMNLPWVFLLILLLVALEWALRKYNGEI